MTNTRADATRTLLLVLEQGCSMSQALSDSSPPLQKEIVYGVTRWYWRLKAYADKLLKKPLRKRDSDVMLLILVGLYQLRELRMPAHASINETVAACEHLGKGWAKGLVNALLRSYIRQEQVLSNDLDDEARFSHPMWMVEHIRQSWPCHWREILTANNVRAPMVLRVNKRCIDRAQYLDDLKLNGISATADALSRDAVILEKPAPVQEIPGFMDGLVSVQDTAAQWAAHVLPIGNGKRVLDACAAPGGKLAHILETYPAAGDVTAIDVSRERVDLMRKSLQRLGLKANLLVSDAGDTGAWWDGNRFDCVMVDAPCSGTGVIRRHPDIKHLRRRSDIAKLAERQRELLERLWHTLAPRGYLLYITCSVLAEENEKQVERFLRDTKNAETCAAPLPAGLKGCYGIQTLPGVHRVDGFYYSLLQKTGS